MEELRHGTEEMTQYIVTMGNGNQIRLFVGSSDWQDECILMANIINYGDIERITRFSTETVSVE